MIDNDIKIEEIRNKYNLTQENLAKTLGVSTRTIQNWEAGGKIPNTKHEILLNLLAENE